MLQLQARTPASPKAVPSALPCPSTLKRTAPQWQLPRCVVGCVVVMFARLCSGAGRVLNKRDTDELPSIRGAILRPQQAERAFRLRRLEPAADLRAFVSHYWLIDWDLPAPFVQSVLPNPAANLVAEHDQLSLSGVWTRRYDRHLEGRGSVYGINFRPAGFHALRAVRGPMHALTDHSRDLAPDIGVDAPALHARLRDAEDDAARAEQLSALLRTLEPEAYPGMAQLDALVALAREDRDLVRAEQLAERGDMTLRSLQRRLREHVGVGPKALIRRFRVQEAAARLAEGERVDLAALALSLGYADQAHFSRDFKATVGASPRAYLVSLDAQPEREPSDC